MEMQRRILLKLNGFLLMDDLRLYERILCAKDVLVLLSGARASFRIRFMQQDRFWVQVMAAGHLTVRSAHKLN